MTDVWTHATTRSVPDFSPGRYLVPAVVTEERTMTLYTGNAFPDDRRPEWLPGQPGDVAEWGGQRWGRSADGEWWNFADSVWEAATDDDVPADAVLVLPARTREVTP